MSNHKDYQFINNIIEAEINAEEYNMSNLPEDDDYGDGDGDEDW